MYDVILLFFFFFSSRRRHTRWNCDWSSDVCSSDLGAVYLRRTPDGKLQAFNVVCPHAGCFVDFLPERGMYLCPCHNSRSEERRVGKECRSRWSQDHDKKKG